MMWWTGSAMHGWGAVLMAVGGLLFWGLVLVVLIFGIRYLLRSDELARGRSSGPEALLAERFARGEIDEGEYHKRMDVLRGGSPQAR